MAFIPAGFTDEKSNIQSKGVQCITKQEFLDWKKSYTFDGLKGIDYGVSFCLHFEIIDYLLVFSHDAEWCDNYIKKVYLK